MPFKRVSASQCPTYRGYETVKLLRRKKTNLMETIEKVQRRFTKRIKGFNCIKYEQRIAKLGLLTLELRRLHLDLIFCYKIVFGLV